MASAAPSPDSSPSEKHQSRKERRYLHALEKGKIRSSGVLEAPVIEFIVDPNADPDEVDKQIRALQGKGHRVVTREPNKPEVVTESENPLSGHAEVLSVVVDDEHITITIPKDHTIEDDGTALGKLGLAVAKQHGSKAKDIVVRRAEE